MYTVCTITFAARPAHDDAMIHTLPTQSHIDSCNLPNPPGGSDQEHGRSLICLEPAVTMKHLRGTLTREQVADRDSDLSRDSDLTRNTMTERGGQI
jgi:hypothetical protein